MVRQLVDPLFKMLKIWCEIPEMQQKIDNRFFVF